MLTCSVLEGKIEGYERIAIKGPIAGSPPAFDDPELRAPEDPQKNGARPSLQPNTTNASRDPCLLVGDQ